ncbi:hypothetical protein X777_00790 [Ooceraea biroi]|uniref:Secreted protein n=1 Tax=Ooceraea biroi TaxID=2015173 RepID=A0A026WNV0_OOCBI|nr:hypothetical protein X777_00790 [Ooceraea biroi]
MGYRLGRRLMIPLAAVFAGILQHSHSTGFCSGALRAHYFPSTVKHCIAQDRLRYRPAQCTLDVHLSALNSHCRGADSAGRMKACAQNSAKKS